MSLPDGLARPPVCVTLSIFVSPPNLCGWIKQKKTVSFFKQIKKLIKKVNNCQQIEKVVQTSQKVSQTSQTHI